MMTPARLFSRKTSPPAPLFPSSNKQRAPAMILSPDQQQALEDAKKFLLDEDPNNYEMSISGPAGTGKTVLTKHLIAEARAMGKMIVLLTDGESDSFDVHLTSTTNKAAKVLSDATGEGAGTIHSLLGLRVVNNYKTGKTELRRSGASSVIKKSLIIIDEGSMANEMLLDEIRKSTHKCKVIYIGDEYQLAPVFESTCPVFNQVPLQSKLTTIQRQAAGSPIIQFANGFREAQDTGVFPVITDLGNEVRLVKGDEFRSLAHAHFTNMPSHNHARMVAWTNDRVHQYNDYLRGLNTSEKDYQIGEFLLTNQPVLDSNNHVVLSTDSIAKVTTIHEAEREHIKGWDITLNNEVSVFQAQIQAQVKIHMKNLARAKDWTRYFAAKEEYADLRPIYSCTVNKAQGSTYRTVFIDLDDISRNNKNNEIARLMYTAITRASHQVIMYGSLPRRLYV